MAKKKKWKLNYANIQALARDLKSDECGIIVCLMGAILQSFHTYHIIYNASQIDSEFGKIIQASGVAIFFSISLVVYTFRAGSVGIIHNPQNKKEIKEENYRREKKRKEYKKYTKQLYIFESIINIHYWTRNKFIDKIDIVSKKVIVDGEDVIQYSINHSIELIDVYDWLISVVYSFFLPYMISSYAGHVKILTKTQIEANKLK